MEKRASTPGDLAFALSSRGVTPTEAFRLVQQHPERIWPAIEWVQGLLDRGEAITNPGAYLASTIRAGGEYLERTLDEYEARATAEERAQQQAEERAQRDAQRSRDWRAEQRDAEAVAASDEERLAVFEEFRSIWKREPVEALQKLESRDVAIGPEWEERVNRARRLGR